MHARCHEKVDPRVERCEALDARPAADDADSIRAQLPEQRSLHEPGALHLDRDLRNQHHLRAVALKETGQEPEKSTDVAVARLLAVSLPIYDGEAQTAGLSGQLALSDGLACAGHRRQREVG